MFSELFAFIAVVVVVVMFCSVIYLILVSLYSYPGCRINCVLTELHWGENSSIHGWEGSIFLNICQQIPLKEQMQEYIPVVTELLGQPHPHSCAAELHCCPKPIKTTLLSLTTAPDDTDAHRLLFISVKLSILLWNSGNLQRCPSEQADMVQNAFLSCLLLPFAFAQKKHQPPEECGHFLPTAETSSSDSLIIIRDGIRQRLESHRVRFIPAITRIESNFGFRSSGEMRLEQTEDAGEQHAASLLHRNMAGHQETFLSGAFSVVRPLLSPIERNMTAHNVVMDTRSRSKSIKPSWV